MEQPKANKVAKNFVLALFQNVKTTEKLSTSKIVFSDDATSHLLSVWEDDGPNDMLFQQDEAHPQFHIAD